MAAAKLIGWGGRALYLGPAFGLTPHRNATAVLAVGLDAPLEVADDPADRTTHYRAARSVLILPNSLHHLRIERGRMAFLYVDPLGRDLKALIARMTNTTPRAAFDLREESGVIEILTGLAESRLAAQDGRALLGELLGVGTRGKTNARIAAALQHMRDEPAAGPPADDLGGARRPVAVAVPPPVQGGDGGAAAALPHLEPDGRGDSRQRRGRLPDGSGPRRRLCQLGALLQRISRHVRHDAVGLGAGAEAGGDPGVTAV